MVEGARLEIVCALIPYRGFESLALRHFFKRNNFSRERRIFDFAEHLPVLTISPGHMQQRESIVGGRLRSLRSESCVDG